jgi:hypothetical protein
VIHRDIEMQFLFQIGTFLATPCNPNCPRSGDFGKLPDKGADRPAGSRDHFHDLRER